MPGIGGALNIARWSLYASQLAVEVTSHNIANANTPGYSRQSLRVSANYPITMGPGQIGTGITAKEIFRAYDQFINEQICEKRSDYYYWDAQKWSLEEIEMIFNESGGYGINYLMSEFWNAWGDLVNNPDGVPEREALSAKTNNLIQAIRNIDYNLRSYQRHLDSNIRGCVDKTNTIIDQIADLNLQISSIEIDGMINANDLRDQRDMLVEELSGYMDISYYEEEQSGQLMVYVLGGTPLVLGKDSYSLSYERNSSTGYTDIFWNDISGRTVNITNKLDGGKIAGWVDVRDNKIDSYLDSMNTLTEELIWQVNSLHSEGVGLKSVSEMTGTVEISDPNISIATAGYSFSDKFQAGDFDIVVYDSDGNVVGRNSVSLAANATANDLITAIGGVGNMNAEIDSDNKLHIYADSGYTFAINPNSSSDSNNALAILGVNTFFSWDADAGAFTQTIDLNSVVSSDTELIAAGYLDSDNKIARGDNQVALSIYGLQDKVIDIAGTNTTLDGFYSSFVSEVGVHVQNAQINEKYNDTLLAQYIKRKESVTGVNLDEEMANLLKFQHAYQAAARLISITDEMMQTLLSIK
ncbi:MAG: flagellar hook-associated protein FlgK [Deltaproteobacteria bacterium]|nr:flagellar hook-associated protein FlgK [Deltaproteobacteria bacterium]